MASSNGWIKLHRRLQDHDLWKLRPFSKGQAWVDLLMSACHAQSRFQVRGIWVDVAPGQVAFSEKNLAARWGWSRSKLRAFFFRLENDHQVIQQKNNVITLVSIVNWHDYQAKDTADQTAKDTAERHIQEVKEVKETTPPIVPPRGKGYSDAFESFWKTYPRRIGKASAFRSFERARKKGVSAEAIIAAVEHHKRGEQWQKEGGQFIPHPTTWLNQGRWDDEVVPARQINPDRSAT